MISFEVDRESQANASAAQLELRATDDQGIQATGSFSGSFQVGVSFSHFSSRTIGQPGGETHARYSATPAFVGT
jgi:hypothetical protein